MRFVVQFVHLMIALKDVHFGSQSRFSTETRIRLITSFSCLPQGVGTDLDRQIGIGLPPSNEMTSFFFGKSFGLFECHVTSNRADRWHIQRGTKPFRPSLKISGPRRIGDPVTVGHLLFV